MIIQLADYSIDRKFIYLLLFFVSHDSKFIIVELLAGHNKQFQYDNMCSWTFLFFKF